MLETEPHDDHQIRKKIVPRHSMKVYGGSISIDPLILKLQHQMDLSGQLLAPAILPPGIRPLNSRVSGRQRRSGRFKEEKNFWTIPEHEHRIRSARRSARQGKDTKAQRVVEV
jgi:hypothetical protein